MHDRELAARLASLVAALDDLQSQSRAYLTVLRGNQGAQAAVSGLAGLARAVRDELSALHETLDVAPSVRGRLTSRERQVLELVARGLGNKQVAYELAISERTVQFHLNSVFGKTGTRSRTQAVVAALAAGLIDAR